MSNNDPFPTSYQQWRHCIEVRCRIKLTPSYVAKRLSELEDAGHVRTKEFAKLYGMEHLERTVTWFRRAADELSG